MRKYVLFIFLFILMSFSSKAQDPQLFENPWYLEKVVIEDEEFFPPQADFVTELLLSLTNFNYLYLSCNLGWGSKINFDTDNPVFTLMGGFISLGDDCTEQDDIDFMLLHESHYYIDAITPLNPFTYTIIDNEGSLTLTITNADGNSAVYGNTLLSTQNFENIAFEIYPNPVRETLFINATTKIESVTIYTLQGKEVLFSENINQELSSIEIASLAYGVYFIGIKDETGNSSIQKFIKRD